MGFYVPNEAGEPAVLVATAAGGSEWLSAGHSASGLAEFIDSIAGPGAAAGGSWVINAHEGFCGVAPTTEWPLEMLSAVARGINDEGERFAKWVDAVGVDALAERPDMVLEMYRDSDRGLHRSIGEFARHEINDRGGLASLGVEEIEEYFDFERYSETYENDTSLLMVPSPGGVHVFDLERLDGGRPSSAEPESSEGFGFG